MAPRMTRSELIAFLRQYRLAVQASVGPGGAPQAAVIGVAVSDDLEIVFDTVDTTRKYENLRADPRIALVIGWEHDATVQLVPFGSEGERMESEISRLIVTLLDA